MKRLSPLLLLSLLHFSCHSQSESDKQDVYANLIFYAEKEDTSGMASLIGQNKLELKHEYGKNNDCLPLLSWCVLENKLTSFDFLLENGSDPNWQDSNINCYYPPAIVLAAQTRETSHFLKSALMHGGDPNLVTVKLQANRRGIRYQSVLLAAVSSARLENVELVVNAGASVNGVTDSLPSPLAVALVHKYLDMAIFLLENGADSKKSNFYTIDGRELSIYELIDDIKSQDNTDKARLKEKILKLLNK